MKDVDECRVDVDQALVDWEYVRGGGSRTWQIDYSRPLSSDAVEVEDARRRWRADQVDEAIGSFGKTKYVRRILSDLILFTVREPHRDLASFRAVPRGADGARVLQEQVRAVRQVIAQRLSSAVGYPK